jgi:nicotinate-nucleotide--dimethylbenzimidazole phosphoribosyltransferase
MSRTLSAELLARLGFNAVPACDAPCRDAAWRRIDSLTKPLGALGGLEALAAQVCAVQRTLAPAITAPVAVVFAADHGVADRGVSAYPREVTRQMVQNFLGGGAAISVLARALGMPLWIVDAGVNGECPAHPQLIAAKIAAGTRDFVTTPAMTVEECHAALQQGRAIIDRVAQAPCNTVLLGEMGIGNTASAALLTHGITAMPLADCVGRGTGLDDAGVASKLATLGMALARRARCTDPVELLTEYGGYEIAMLVGAILGAAARGLLAIVDGFTVTVAAALAAQLDAHAQGYCVFGHVSAEKAHRALLAQLQVRPLLDLGMRLGEGSGAALALPVVQSAVALFTQMATFAGAGVSEKSA